MAIASSLGTARRFLEELGMMMSSSDDSSSSCVVVCASNSKVSDMNVQ
jgi:hypothetical protein